MRTMSKKAKADAYDVASAEAGLYRKALADLVRGPDASKTVGHYTATVVGCWRLARGGSPSVIVTFDLPSNGHPDVQAHDAQEWHDRMVHDASVAICGSDDHAYRREWEGLRELCEFVRHTVNAAWKAQGHQGVFIGADSRVAPLPDWMR